MKHCPVCQNTYTDDSLQFCLADGAALYFSSSEQPTEQFSAGTNPIRVNITQNENPTIVAQKKYPPPEPEENKGGGLNVVVGLVIGFVITSILAAIAIAGIIWWQKSKVADNNPTPTPNITNSTTQTPTQTPTPDEAAILKEKIANLEKKVNEQKTTKPTVPTLSNTTTPQSNKVTARANSPGDGFLALRTQPSAETGDRILKIPHGATLTVLGCLPKAPGKNGRWCRVDYNGNQGWAFDGYMIYQ